jgi:hypothetical protein
MVEITPENYLRLCKCLTEIKPNTIPDSLILMNWLIAEKKHIFEVYLMRLQFFGDFYWLKGIWESNCWSLQQYLHLSVPSHSSTHWYVWLITHSLIYCHLFSHSRLSIAHYLTFSLKAQLKTFEALGGEESVMDLKSRLDQSYKELLSMNVHYCVIFCFYI